MKTGLGLPPFDIAINGTAVVVVRIISSLTERA